MAHRRYWQGFAAGLAAGTGGALATLAAVNLIGNAGRNRVVRIEKSIQIGRPVQEVFQRWASLEWLQEASDLFEDITVENHRSHWSMHVDGRQVQWDAEIEQFL